MQPATYQGTPPPRPIEVIPMTPDAFAVSGSARRPAGYPRRGYGSLPSYTGDAPPPPGTMRPSDTALSQLGSASHLPPPGYGNPPPLNHAMFDGPGAPVIMGGYKGTPPPPPLQQRPLSSAAVPTVYGNQPLPGYTGDPPPPPGIHPPLQIQNPAQPQIPGQSINPNATAPFVQLGYAGSVPSIPGEMDELQTQQQQEQQQQQQYVGSPPPAPSSVMSQSQQQPPVTASQQGDEPSYPGSPPPAPDEDKKSSLTRYAERLKSKITEPELLERASEWFEEGKRIFTGDKN